MRQTFRKLISLVVLMSCSVLLLGGEGYAAAPIVELMVFPDTSEVSIGAEPIAIAARASGSNLTYAWNLLGLGKLEGEGPAVFYHVPETLEKDSARVIITVTVTDGEGQEITETVVFTLRAGQVTAPPPVPEAAEEPASPEPSQKGSAPVESESKGMSKRTKIIIGGVATAAAIGGGVALLMMGDKDEDEKNGPFTGTFRGQFVGQTDSGETTYDTITFTLTQKGDAVTGTLNISSQLPGWCTVSLTVTVTGIASGTSAVLNIGPGQSSCQSPDGGTYTISMSSFTANVSLTNNDNTLRFDDGTEFPRVAKVVEADDEVKHRSIDLKGDFVRQ
jgi:hypothetical protein